MRQFVDRTGTLIGGIGMFLLPVRMITDGPRPQRMVDTCQIRYNTDMTEESTPRRRRKRVKSPVPMVAVIVWGVIDAFWLISVKTES